MKEMATHSSILAWEIPWTEEPGGLQSMGSQSQTGLSTYTATKARYNSNLRIDVDIFENNRTLMQLDQHFSWCHLGINFIFTWHYTHRRVFY